MRQHNQLPEETEAQVIAAIMSGRGQNDIIREFKIGRSSFCRLRALATAGRDSKFDLAPNRYVGKVTTQVNAAGDIERHWIRHLPSDVSIEDTAAHIAGLFEGFQPIRIAPATAPTSDSDTLTVYPIADIHLGMRAWAKEVGESYDTGIASRRVIEWATRCISSSPSSETAIILDVGDGTHGDDQTNQTPRSKHILDVDTRHFHTLDVAIFTYAAVIEIALAKHGRVIVRILPGNHNPNSYLAIMFALAERYRDEPRVKVQKVPGEFFVHQFGKVMIGAHHGDKAKADRLVMFFADQYPEIWGATKHRFLFTAHLHHSVVRDIGGVKCEQLRAVTSKDAYSTSHSYTARAEMQAITYHRETGEISRVRVTS